MPTKYSILCSGLTLVVLFGCADGSELVPNENVGASGGSGGAGGGGSGGMGGALQGGMPATGGGITGGDGGGEVCAEDPCKLVAPQCGCGDGEQCSVSPNGQAPTFRSCIAEGATPLGGACTIGGCVPGAMCVNTGSSICMEFCADDTMCDAPGGLCAVDLNDGLGGTIPNVTLCSQNCDPVTSTGCPNGTSCQIGREPDGQMRFFTICRGAGTATQNQPCDPLGDDCAAGYSCFEVDNGTTLSNVCLHYCKTSTPADCSPGLVCQTTTPPFVVGGNTYGACL